MRWRSNWLSRLLRNGEFGLVFGLSALLFAWYQAIPTFPDPDAFYHARFTALLLQHGLITEFPWLPLTTLGQAFADHHLLYHIVLMPAVYVLGPIVGVKVMQALFCVGLVAAGYGILKRWGVPYAGPAMLLLFSSYPMLVRMNLVKASTVAVILFLLILVALLEKKYGTVAVLTIVYSLTHGGFFLALVLAIVVWIAQCFSQLIARKPFVPPLPTGVLMVALAMLLGVLANPYFPSNIPFLWAQFFQIGVVNYQSVIEVGAEWYPFALPDLIGAVSILLLGLVGVVAVIVKQWKQVLVQERTVALLILFPVFAVLTLRSRRFIEYLVPVLWLLICLVLLPAIQQGLIKRWWSILGRSLGKVMLLINGYLIIAVTFAVVSIYSTLFKDFYHQESLNRLAAAGAYLRTVTEPNVVIFHGRWDDFPELFFYNPRAAYVAGLDATFLYLADAELYGHWHAIAAGERKQQTAQDIRQYFQARYVVIDRTDEQTKLMLAYLLRDSTVQSVFGQDNIQVFDLGV